MPASGIRRSMELVERDSCLETETNIRHKKTWQVHDGTHVQFLSVFRELSSLLIGGTWQYSFTTSASSATCSFLAS